MRMIDVLRRYDRELTAQGFTRITFKASPSLIDALVTHRHRGETIGLCFERLVTGSNDPRPAFDPEREARQAANRARHIAEQEARSTQNRKAERQVKRLRDQAAELVARSKAAKAVQP